MTRRVLPETERTAYQRALRRLARRDHSEHELRAALLERGCRPGDVEAALVRLRGQRYLDDGAFAERFARSRLRRGLGRRRIRHGLSRRGVARPTAEAGLATALRDVPEPAVLEQVARRYWRQRREDPPQKRLRRLWALLLRRGFPAELVRERLRRLWPRWAEGLPPEEEPGPGGSDDGD